MHVCVCVKDNMAIVNAHERHLRAIILHSLEVYHGCSLWLPVLGSICKIMDALRSVWIACWKTQMFSLQIKKKILVAFKCYNLHLTQLPMGCRPNAALCGYFELRFRDLKLPSEPEVLNLLMSRRIRIALVPEMMLKHKGWTVFNIFMQYLDRTAQRPHPQSWALLSWYQLKSYTNT